MCDFIDECSEYELVCNQIEPSNIWGEKPNCHKPLITNKATVAEVPYSAKDGLIKLLEEFDEMIHMKSHGFSVYKGAGEVIESMEFEIEEFLTKNCH